MLVSLAKRALHSSRRKGQLRAQQKSSRLAKRLLVQNLEPRNLLAGDVGAEIVDDTLYVTGDSSSNSIRIDAVQRTRQDSIGVTGGVTSVSLDPAVLAAVRLQVTGAENTTDPIAGLDVGFPINDETDFEFTTDHGFTPLKGTIEHDGTLALGVLDPDGELTDVEVIVGDFTIGFDPERISDTTSGFFVADNQDLDFILFDVGIPGFLEIEDSSLSIGDADLLVSDAFASFLSDAGLAEGDVTGVDAGDAQIDADTAEIAMRRVNGGKTSVGLNVDLLASVGLEVSSLNGTAKPAGDDFQVAFKILRDSDFVFDQGEGFVPIEGRIEHKGSVGFNEDSLIVGNFSIGFDPDRAGKEFPTEDGVEVTSGFFVQDTKDLGIILFDVGAPGTLDNGEDRLKIGEANLLVSDSLASTLDQEIEGVVVGAAQIDAYTTKLKDEFLRVSGKWLRGKTTINGERAFEVPADQIENLVIEMGDGKDTVRVKGVSLPGNLTVDLGDGWRNTATLYGVHVDGLMSILGGDGRDSIRMTRSGAGSLEIDTDGNSDVVYLLWSKVDGDADVDLGDGRDRLSVIGSDVGGSADFNGGSGSDRFFSILSRYGDGGPETEGFRGRFRWWF
jgi:hypothetical protein